MNAEPKIIYTPEYLKHAPNARISMYPEAPFRVGDTIKHLYAYTQAGHVLTPKPATREQVLKCHTEKYLARIKVPQNDDLAEVKYTDNTARAAMLAAGAACMAVDMARQGSFGGGEIAFSLSRPPGHHAHRERGAGFCVLANAAIAAEHALATGSKRVLILDHDLHHGDGTQEAFYNRSDVLYMSTHESPNYPNTGLATEVGAKDGKGFTVNVPLAPGCKEEDILRVYRNLFVPIAREYNPDVVIVSAGYDIYEKDAMGEQHMTMEGFNELARIIKTTTKNGLAILLEGGYHEDIPRLIEASLEGYKGNEQKVKNHRTSSLGRKGFEFACSIQKDYWRIV